MRRLLLVSLFLASTVSAQTDMPVPQGEPVASHQIPASSSFSGLSRRVIAYSEYFSDVMAALKQPDAGDEVWAPLESLVDTATFERQGVFSEGKTERFGWDTYKQFIQAYAAGTHWEGSLRFIMEEGRMVVLGLEERSTYAGVTNTANTVTVYRFNDRDQLIALEVYVMPLGE